MAEQASRRCAEANRNFCDLQFRIMNIDPKIAAIWVLSDKAERVVIQASRF